nr:bile salt-activated lipase-like [Penaeus vannamei]
MNPLKSSCIQIINLLAAKLGQDTLAGTAYNLDKASADDLVQNFSVSGPLSLTFEGWEEDPEYLARRAFHHYLGPIELTEEKRDPIIRLYSDRLFDMCHMDAVGQHLRTSQKQVFTYKLQHRGEHQYVSTYFPSVPDWVKNYVTHADDLQYLFNQEEYNMTLQRDEDLFVSRIMVELWTNFAAKGHPTPDLSLGFKWAPTLSSSNSYLAITSSPFMKTFQECRIHKFWKNMPTKTNQRLYPDRFEPLL